MSRRRQEIVSQNCRFGTVSAENAVKCGFNLAAAPVLSLLLAERTGDRASLVGVTGSPFTCHNDSRYPNRLAALDCPPPALFIAGDSACLETRQLTMIGSRQYRLYSKQWGDYFASQLSADGLTITSGLVLDIDGACHSAALAAWGKTVAVLSCGIDYGYPRQHCQLAADIVAYEGALVSEFLPYVPTLAMYFPFRNRLISGLSIGAYGGGGTI